MSIDFSKFMTRLRHSREGGNPVTRQGWIPAFAGMTNDVA